jgi:uncharacterized protein (DUF2267 family)
MNIQETQNPNFDTFAQDAHEYANQLAASFGHPQEQRRSLRIWRAVLHTIRDRMHLGEAMELMAPLPVIYRGIYAEQWNYSEKPPLSYSSFEEMVNIVEEKQRKLGEEGFHWEKSTEELIAITLDSLRKFVPEAQFEHIMAQMPKDVQEALLEKVL